MISRRPGDEPFCATLQNTRQLADLEYNKNIGISEETVKEVVYRQLRKEAYSPKMSSRRGKGADIEGWSSRQGGILVEAKGEPSRPELFHNYFLAALGQVVLRFSANNKRYVVALPIHERYVKLIRKVSQEARKRLNLEFWLVGTEPIRFSIYVIDPNTP